ncbi:hypothetical protein FAIPA1_30121 [Frankia sp. AiPs1]
MRHHGARLGVAALTTSSLPSSRFRGTAPNRTPRDQSPTPGHLLSCFTHSMSIICSIFADRGTAVNHPSGALPQLSESKKCSMIFAQTIESEARLCDTGSRQPARSSPLNR